MTELFLFSLVGFIGLLIGYWYGKMEGRSEARKPEKDALPPETAPNRPEGYQALARLWRSQVDGTLAAEME